jgi:hypothetical protein
MEFPVKNMFYLHGELVKPGDVVELTEEEVEYFRPKNVIGKEVVFSGSGQGNEKDPALRTLDAFTSLSAAEQKDLLAELKIEGDDSNPDKRTALYAVFLEAAGGDPDADND